MMLQMPMGTSSDVVPCFGATWNTRNTTAVKDVKAYL